MRSTLVLKGFRCLKEPRIPVQNTFLKPDLVCWNGRRIIFLDPIICGDRVRLAEREAQKVALYNTPEVLAFSKNVANERNGRNEAENEIEVEVFGVAIGNRGAVRPATVRTLRTIGVSSYYLNFMLIASMVASWRMVKAYGYATSHRRRRRMGR